MLYTHQIDCRSEMGWSGPTGNIGSLERLCSISLRACQLMNPLISAIYEQLLESLNNSSEDSIATVKSDNSAFTIADGLVQRLLIQVLYANVGFRDIVGEEDDDEKKEQDDSWFKVQGLDVPMNLRSLVECTKSDIESLAEEYFSTTSNEQGNKNNYYQHLTVFIDPVSREISLLLLVHLDDMNFTHRFPYRLMVLKNLVLVKDIILLFALDLRMRMANLWEGWYIVHYHCQTQRGWLE